MKIFDEHTIIGALYYNEKEYLSHKELLIGKGFEEHRKWQEGNRLKVWYKKTIV